VKEKGGGEGKGLSSINYIFEVLGMYLKWDRHPLLSNRSSAKERGKLLYREGNRGSAAGEITFRVKRANCVKEGTKSVSRELSSKDFRGKCERDAREDIVESNSSTLS